MKIPSNAVWEATGTDAASSKERLDGFPAMAAALTARYCAYAPIPLVVPNTASPGAHAATSTRYSLKSQSSWRALASTATPIIERPARRGWRTAGGKIAFPELIFESPLDKPGASCSRSSAYSCMHVTCYEALPYLANSKVGRSFRDPQANAYARVSRLTGIDAASSDVESL